MQDLLDRIVAAAPDPLRLTDDEFVRLSAYLRTHRRTVSFSAQQKAARGDLAARARLEQDERRWNAWQCTLEYNRELRAADNAAAPAASPEYQERFMELMQGIAPLSELLQPATPPAPTVPSESNAKRSTECGEGQAKGADAHQKATYAKRVRGRPSIAVDDPLEASDRQRAVDAWKTGRYRTTAECARELGYRADGETPFTASFVRAAIDAARKRPRK